MSKIIAEAQMNEIVQLAKNGHGEALIHYGGDMYLRVGLTWSKLWLL